MTRQQRTPLLVAGGAVLLLLPAIVAAIAIVRPQWYPTGDLAQAELHVRGFWEHPPLVGAAGRIQNTDGVQGSHPGPLMWLALWPVYAAGGSTSTSLVVSVVLVHTITLGVALWLAVRRGGVVFAVALAATLAILVRAGGPEVFTEPWNPWMGLLPFLLFILAAWSILDGERWAIVLAVAAGTYCVQAHAGYVVVVVGLLLFVATMMVVWSGWRRAAPWLGAAAVVGVVLWIPPVLDQLRRDPGNFSILGDNFGNPDGPYLALSRVAEIVVVQLNLLGPWMRGPSVDDVDVLTVLGFVGFVALWVLAARAARRRRASSELHLHALLAVAAVLAVVAISRIFGSYFEYTIRWVWMIVATVIAASITSLWRSRPVTGRAGLAVAAVTIVTVVAIGAVQFADRAGPTGAIDSRIVGPLAAEVEPMLSRDTPYLLRWWDPAVLGATAFGMVLELERQGYTVGIDAPYAAAAMPHRVQAEETAGAVLYLVLGEPSIERARAVPGLEELGSYDVRTPAERRRSDELRSAIEQGLVDAGQADRVPMLDAFYGIAQLQFGPEPAPPELRPAIDEYVALRQPAALFRAAPGTPVLPLG
jgi:hypothetical protein